MTNAHEEPWTFDEVLEEMALEVHEAAREIFKRAIEREWRAGRLQTMRAAELLKRVDTRARGGPNR